MQLFFNPNITEHDKQVLFNKEESRHICKVLRKSEGDILYISNGLGSIYKAELTTVSDKQCEAYIQDSKQEAKPSYHLHLAVAPTKLNDRYEWFLEKATEIGVSEITPVYCDRSERKIIKPERLEKIVQSALKQSLKAWLPKLNPAVTYSDFINNHNPSNVNCIAHCEEDEKLGLAALVKPGDSVCILIGPEGDFSSEEIRSAKKAGFAPIHLGKSRLRTETAAVVACHSVAFINDN